MVRDCARAVACLHAVTPEPLIHCDLKSLNFLVSLDAKTRRVVVKLSDLELTRGAQGDLFRSISGSELKSGFSTIGAGGLSYDLLAEDEDETYRTFSTFNWTAPEILTGGLPTPRSDVYALAMVAWEVLHPGHKPFDSLHLTDAVEIAEPLLLRLCNAKLGGRTVYRRTDQDDQLTSEHDHVVHMNSGNGVAQDPSGKDEDMLGAVPLTSTSMFVLC